jgi:hypothetical protein
MHEDSLFAGFLGLIIGATIVGALAGVISFENGKIEGEKIGREKAEKEYARRLEMERIEFNVERNCIVSLGEWNRETRTCTIKQVAK